jgi:hypothetical protein
MNVFFLKAGGCAMVAFGCTVVTYIHACFEFFVTHNFKVLKYFFRSAVARSSVSLLPE